MSGPERLTIGEFARLTWLSPRALRLYERRGLLRPDAVDEYTGYRYYRPAQAEQARAISLLRRAGMPLEQISAVLDARGARRRSLVDAYRAATILEHQRAIALLDDVASELAGSDVLPSTSPVRRRPARSWSFVSCVLRTTAEDLPSHIEKASAALIHRAGASRDDVHPLAVVYHGEVGWESDGPIEVRVPTLAHGSADGSEPAGIELYVEVPYGEIQFPTILRAFDAVRAAAQRDGRRAAGAPRELYSVGDPFRCEVAQPVSEATASWPPPGPA
ncbi:MerR family transcriptional regulator [Janibacter melonis]|uniref:MerR family transcriptional regulator n=1 Tax=Janibacter melonis TaxID=262209 RepID=UPI0017481338|nr:helix-turn-helix domain-containing protein [Janibacter melonis]MCB5991742.1 helix-turn-helix domain-containing protein [Janibacter melonis]